MPRYAFVRAPSTAALGTFAAALWRAFNSARAALFSQPADRPLLKKHEEKSCSWRNEITATHGPRKINRLSLIACVVDGKHKGISNVYQ
jgi:hypothetical protein